MCVCGSFASNESDGICWRENYFFSPFSFAVFVIPMIINGAPIVEHVTSFANWLLLENVNLFSYISLLRQFGWSKFCSRSL